MPQKKWKHPLSDLIVQAKDCYDPADYVLVHKDYLARLQQEHEAAVSVDARASGLTPCPSCGDFVLIDGGSCETCGRVR